MVTTSHNKPNTFPISRNLSTLTARCYISGRSLYTHPVPIPFLKHSLCGETGLHGRWIIGLVQCTRFYILSTGLSHTSFPNLQRHKLSFPSELLTLSATLPRWTQKVIHQFLLKLNVFPEVLTQTAEHNLQGYEA